MAKVLYISLTGMGEAIGKSQVFEYLVDLSKNHSISLLTFERLEDENQFDEINFIMDKHNIEWTYLIYSNKYGLFSAITQQIKAIFYGFKIAKKHKVDLIHARSMLTALMAKIIIIFYKTKLLFDIRDFATDEKVDRGRIKRDSFLYKILLKLEIMLYKKSNYIVALTYVSKDILHKRFNINKSNIEVIPTCANNQVFNIIPENEKVIFKRKLGFSDNDIIIIHTGTVTRWYLFEEEVLFIKKLMKKNNLIKFLLINKGEHEFIKKALNKYSIPSNKVHITYSKYEDVKKYLNISDLSIYFIKPTYANKATLPTKFAELVACHIPSLINKGIGDMDMYVSKYNVGYSVDIDNITDENLDIAYDMLINKDIERKYNELFSEHFDKSIAVKKYNDIYNKLSEKNEK